jgi:uncharacterized protein (DUF849 family)
VQEGVKKHCPGMIIQFSTGGRGRSQNERGRALNLKPDMASLATGSVNFPKQIYENPPDLVEDLARAMLENNVKPEIEVFDLAMLYNARDLAERGLIKKPLHVQFVMGIPNALPARRKVLEFLVSELKDIMPGATWASAGIGRHQLEINEWTLALGGNLRTGLEDNIKFDKDRLAKSNAELECRAGRSLARHVRPIRPPRREPEGGACDLGFAGMTLGRSQVGYRGRLAAKAAMQIKHSVKPSASRGFRGQKRCAADTTGPLQ